MRCRRASQTRPYYTPTEAPRTSGIIAPWKIKISVYSVCTLARHDMWVVVWSDLTGVWSVSFNGSCGDDAFCRSTFRNDCTCSGSTGSAWDCSTEDYPYHQTAATKDCRRLWRACSTIALNCSHFDGQRVVWHDDMCGESSHLCGKSNGLPVISCTYQCSSRVWSCVVHRFNLIYARITYNACIRAYEVIVEAVWYVCQYLQEVVYMHASLLSERLWMHLYNSINVQTSGERAHLPWEELLYLQIS